MTYLRIVLVLVLATRSRHTRVTRTVVIHTSALVELQKGVSKRLSSKLILFTLALAVVLGSARIKLAAFSEAVTMRAEGFVEGSPGKILASTTKMLSVP